MVASGSRLTWLLTLSTTIYATYCFGSRCFAHFAAIQVGKKVYNTSRYTQPNIVVL